MTIHEICDKAADLIEKKGWCRGHFTARGHFCIVGAIQQIDSYHFSAYRHITRILGLPPGLNSLVAWNDKQKSRKPVIAVLRKAAKTPLACKNELSFPPFSAF